VVPEINSQNNHRQNDAMTSQSFRIGRWLVTPARNRISSAGSDKTIEPKVMRVLEVLIRRQGLVVSRSEIEDSVWPNALIGDKTLTRAISEIRKAVGDNADQPEFVETVARRGYRLIPKAIPLEKPANARHRILYTVAATTFVIVIVLAALSTRERNLDVHPWRQLTSRLGLELTPSPSPTGDLIAFARTPRGEATTSIFVKQANSQSDLRLTNNNGFDISPRWSPDGSQIAFMRYDESSCEILVTAALGGDTRKIAACRLHPRRVNFAPTLDWAPDGERIAYVDRAENGQGRCIMIANLNNGTTTVVSAPSMTECLDDVDPVFSPDGDSIAFTRFFRRSVGDLFTIDLTDGTTTRLTEDYRTQLGVAWDSDSSIIFSSDRSGTYRLWRVEIRTRDIQWLPAVGWNIKRPSISRAGTIAYENWRYDMNIWSGDSSNSTPTRLIASTVWDFHPGLSPNGTQVAFVSNRSGSFEMWLLEDDGNGRQLTHSSNRVVGFPSWSPDAKRIAYVLQAKDRFEIAVINLDGSEVTRIRSNGDAIAPSWSPDGNSLVYGSDLTSEWQIRKYTFADGKEHQLTKSGGYRGAIMSNGDLYYTKPGESGIWRQRTNLDEEMVIDDLPVANWANWQLIEDRIVYVPATGGGLIVWDSLNPDDAEKILTQAIGSANAQSVQVTNDLKKILWAQLDDVEADIVVGEID
jgi:Tol biopolymer transport system component